mmetsp:Transcript_16966/g.36868  ORF Transcript_16966/g.36868 Transcript_16966/m.36868 type:complete len:345 (+) Transcript_16966:215-1249(+)
MQRASVSGLFLCSCITAAFAVMMAMMIPVVSAQPNALPEGKCFCRKKNAEPCFLTTLESTSGSAEFCDLATLICEPCECVMDEEDGLFICDVVEHPSYSIINELTSECVLDMVMVAMCPDDTCEEFVDYEAMETETGPSRRIATQSDGEKSPEIASNAVTRPVPQQVIEGTAYLVRCLFCNDGPAAPAGQCQSYDCGGNSNVHFYTCCNNAGDACDGETYDGLSAEPYCGLAGANNGGGCAREKPFNCGGCQLQTACKNWVDANFLAIPFTCFNWQDAFEACCKDGNPADGVDGWSNLNLLLPDLLPNRILAQDKLTSPSNRQEQCVQVAVPDDRCCELEECSL